MNHEQPVVFTIPTELGRQDGFVDSAILIGAGLAAWWLALNGVPVWAFVPGLACLSIFVLTGEPASDVPFIGALASALRSKLGLRRAHEWIMAWWHFTAVRTWPDFRQWSNTTWQNSRLRSAIPTLSCSVKLPSVSGALRRSRLLRSSSKS